MNDSYVAIVRSALGRNHLGAILVVSKLQSHDQTLQQQALPLPLY